MKKIKKLYGDYKRGQVAKESLKYLKDPATEWMEWTDEREMIKIQVLPSGGFPPLPSQSEVFRTKISITEEDPLHCAIRIVGGIPKPGDPSQTISERPFVLNMGNGFVCCGQTTHGGKGQEEDLCRRTDLIKFLNDARETNWYPLPEYGGIYSTPIYILRNDATESYSWLHAKQFPKISVMTAAAYHKPDITDVWRHAMKRKVFAVLHTAAWTNHQIIILSAWGCGVSENPPSEVALIFKDVIFNSFPGRFKSIVFAIHGFSKKDRHWASIKKFIDVFGHECASEVLYSDALKHENDVLDNESEPPDEVVQHASSFDYSQLKRKAKEEVQSGSSPPISAVAPPAGKRPTMPLGAVSHCGPPGSTPKASVGATHPEKRYAEVRPGLPPGVKPGTPPGIKPGMPPGVKPGMPPGVEPGMSPGTKPGMPPWMKPGMPPGMKPGMPPGMKPGMPPGMKPGMPPDVKPGMPPGMKPGMPPGMKPGMPPGLLAGLPPGMKPGMPPGMKPGMPPGMKPGMPPGMKSGKPPGMKPGMAQDAPPGVPPGMKPGMPPGMKPGMPPGVKLSMPPEAQPGMSPGMKFSMPPGMKPGMPPGMKPAMPPGVTPGMPPWAKPGLQPGGPPGMPARVRPDMPPGGKAEMPSPNQLLLCRLSEDGKAHGTASNGCQVSSGGFSQACSSRAPSPKESKAPAATFSAPPGASLTKSMFIERPTEVVHEAFSPKPVVEPSAEAPSFARSKATTQRSPRETDRTTKPDVMEISNLWGVLAANDPRFNDNTEERRAGIRRTSAGEYYGSGVVLYGKDRKTGKTGGSRSTHSSWQSQSSRQRRADDRHSGKGRSRGRGKGKGRAKGSGNKGLWTNKDNVEEAW